MPTYTYACTDCDEQLEVVQSFTAEPLTECPRCQGRLRKVFHPVGVVFKGSGFYRTDSRSGQKAAAGKNGTEASTQKSGDKPSGTSGEKSGASSGSGSSDAAAKGSSSSGSGGSGGGSGSGGSSSGATSKGSSSSGSATTSTT